eukprot:scaffold141996_cov39-Tisochrysis_lutea.AAC.2
MSERFRASGHRVQRAGTRVSNITAPTPPGSCCLADGTVCLLACLPAVLLASADASRSPSAHLLSAQQRRDVANKLNEAVLRVRAPCRDALR